MMDKTRKVASNPFSHSEILQVNTIAGRSSPNTVTNFALGNTKLMRIIPSGRARKPNVASAASRNLTEVASDRTFRQSLFS